MVRNIIIQLDITESPDTIPNITAPENKNPHRNSTENSQQHK